MNELLSRVLDAHGGMYQRGTVRDVSLWQAAVREIGPAISPGPNPALREPGRSLHTNFGFEPRNALLVETNLSVAGCSRDDAPALQKRMIEAIRRFLE